MTGREHGVVLGHEVEHHDGYMRGTAGAGLGRLIDRCDLVVATAAMGSETGVTQERTVLDFLNGDVVLRWAERTLGL